MRIDMFYEPITKKQFWSFTVYGVHQSYFQEHLYKKKFQLIHCGTF